MSALAGPQNWRVWGGQTQRLRFQHALVRSTCSAGRWSCQERPCPGTCAVLGGAHFSTFDERQYTVHGDCSYVLAKVRRAGGRGVA